jgi:hypothetical protein
MVSPGTWENICNHGDTCPGNQPPIPQAPVPEPLLHQLGGGFADRPIVRRLQFAHLPPARSAAHQRQRGPLGLQHPVEIDPAFPHTIRIRRRTVGLCPTFQHQSPRRFERFNHPRQTRHRRRPELARLSPAFHPPVISTRPVRPSQAPGAPASAGPRAAKPSRLLPRCRRRRAPLPQGKMG